MTATMKGLLKGLRYITRVFEDEKEPEMQIGHPTDVKHVAHIGWEGPSANTPSWMNEFKPPELTTEPSSSKGSLNQKAGTGTKEAKNKTRRKSSAGTSSPLDSPRKSGSAETSKQSRKQSRQRKSKGSTGGDPMAKSSRGKEGDFSGTCPFTGLGTSKGI